MKEVVAGIITTREVTFPDRETGEIVNRTIIRTTEGEVWTNSQISETAEACVIRKFDAGDDVPWAEGETFDKPFLSFEGITSIARLKAAKTVKELAADVLATL